MLDQFSCSEKNGVWRRTPSLWREPGLCLPTWCPYHKTVSKSGLSCSFASFPALGDVSSASIPGGHCPALNVMLLGKYITEVHMSNLEKVRNNNIYCVLSHGSTHQHSSWDKRMAMSWPAWAPQEDKVSLNYRIKSCLRTLKVRAAALL